jgi:hypothetical protein
LLKRAEARRRGFGGGIILIALIAAPLLLLGIIAKFVQYSSVAGVFESFGGSGN